MNTSVALLAATLAVGSALAAEQPPVVPLWPGGAPGFEARKDEPEKIVNARKTNIHNPSVTVFLPPKSQTTGAAVVIAPGGGHGHVTVDHEGYAVARWLAEHGIAGFVLTYRLARDEAAGGKSPYTVEGHALADAQRALRLVRSRATDWGVDPAKVGIMGFSAGGELAILAATRAGAGKPDDADSVERQSARPDFAALMYSVGLTRPDLALTNAMPPLFLACGADDRLSEPFPAFYAACRKAGVSAELHIFAGVGHGFGVQEKTPTDVRIWPELFRGWLVDRKFVGNPAP
jgi:acetyl esterase/lipase